MNNYCKEIIELAKGNFNNSIIEWSFIKHLGDGCHGVVQLVECPNLVVIASKKLALKIFKIGDGHFLQELKTFQKIQESANVAFINVAYGYSVGNSNESSTLLLEFIENGTLENAIMNLLQETINPYLLGFCLAELSEGLDSLHRLGLVHQDLHMDNVFIRDNGHLVIGDFGLTRSLVRPYTATRRVVEAGQSAHYPPEMRLDNQLFINHTVDYFALGVMAYEISTGAEPIDPLSAEYSVLKDRMYDKVYPIFRDCLMGLMDPNMNTRLCNNSYGNVSLLMTEGIRVTVWEVLGTDLTVYEVKKKIGEFRLPSPFLSRIFKIT